MNGGILDLAASVVEKAKRAGASAADALVVEGSSTDVEVRDGAIERLERSEGRDLGLRVFVGQSTAVVAGSALDDDGLDRLVEMGLAMAKAAPPDPFVGLAPASAIARSWPALDLADARAPDAEELKRRALSAEASALAVEGVTKSGGASASASDGAMALVTSEGFAGSYRKSGRSVSVSAIAGEGTGMERDFDYSYACHDGDLERGEEIGRSAGARAVRRLGSRKIASCKVPVVYEARAAAGLVGHLLSAANGSTVARGTSFLKESMGKTVFAKGISILDDPLRPRGLASRPFDAEGFATRRLELVRDGVLASWLLDLHSARQLRLAPSGNAARGTAGPPSPSSTNAYLCPGAKSPEELLRETGTGLYVTELIGMGVNLVTGDYSRGASGYWIENGELAYPVSEITIAGKLLDMFASLAPANDLKFRAATNAPTTRVEGLTVAGR
jgi:PmbA protein